MKKEGIIMLKENKSGRGSLILSISELKSKISKNDIDFERVVDDLKKLKKVL